jgi:hypothetical protein
VQQLGPAAGGLVNEGANMIAAALAFLTLLVGGLMGILFLANVRRGMNESTRAPLNGGHPQTGLRSADVLDGVVLGAVEQTGGRAGTSRVRMRSRATRQ